MSRERCAVAVSSYGRVVLGELMRMWREESQDVSCPPLATNDERRRTASR